MKKKEEKIELPLSAGKFMKKFIVIECAWLYITLVLLDMGVFPALENSTLFRIGICGILSAIVAMLFIKGTAKNCLKSEENLIKRNMVIAPIIVAVILAGYGIYSVNLNVEEIKSSGEYILLERMGVSDELEELIKEAKTEAYADFVATGVAVLVGAEVVVFLKKKKISDVLKDDMTLNNDLGGIITGEGNVNQEVNIGVNNPDNTAQSNVKWDI